MANYASQYTFGVSADTKSAQSSLNALTKSLREIQSAKYHVSVDTAKIEEASKAAGTLHSALQNAMNVNTGKLDLTKFNSNLKEAGTSVGELGNKLLSVGTQGQQAFSQLTATIAGAQAPVKRFNAALSQIGTTLMNTIKWQASSSLIHGLMSSISGAISYAKNLNSTLNDIRIVTGQSSDDMAKFAQAANRAAKELATSTNEFAKASLIYYQQGDSAELAAKKAAITTKAANVAFTASAQEMSEMLTAVWNSYQAGEDQLEHMVDVLAKLGATTASSMEEMATGMQKVAATANTVGVSMEQMSAIVATSASVTRQAPQTIGTAWNTILSRIGGLKLGETLEDGVDLNKYSKALQAIGVDILDASGNLRDMGGVVDEIGAKWDNLNQAQKSALAQTIGGARQYTQILAFFENFDKYQANMRTAQNADGALQEQQEIYAESWEAASKRAQAAMETVYNQLINDKAIIQIKDFFTTLLNLGTSISSTFGGLGNVIALIGTALINANIDKISTSIGEAGTAIKQLFSGNQEINEYAASLSEMRTQMEGLVARDDISSSAKTELAYDIKILEMKEQLANASDRLTQKQKDQAEQYIQNMQSQKEYYAELLREQEELLKQADTSKNNIKQQIKEHIANSTGSSEADGYVQRRADLRTANRMVMDVLSDDQYNKLQEAAILMGVIKDKSEEVTADKLVETLAKSNQEAGKFVHQLDEIDKAFTETKDKATGQSYYDINTYLGTDEARKSMLTSLATSVANSSDSGIAAQGQAQLTALESIDPSNAVALQGVLNALIPLLHDAASAAQKAADDTANAGTAAGASAEEIRTLANSSHEAGEKMGQMADDAEAAAQRIKSKFEESIKRSNTTIQGFVTTATTMTRVATAINSIGNALNKLSDPDVDAWQKFTTVLSTFGSIAFATQAIMRALTSAHKGLIAQTWKNMVAAAADTTAQTAHSAAYMAVAGAVATADKAIKAFLASNPIGWILAIVAAVAALVAIIASLIASANKKWEKDMAERQKDLQEAMDKTSESTQKLQTDLQNLQEIMSDTTLTYEEQLTKINEICNAYGIQATMLDVLSGNYEGLAKSMKKAAEAQIDADYDAALANVDEANAIVDARTKRNGSAVTKTYNAGTGRSFWTGRINDPDEIDALMALKGSIEELGFKVSEYGITGTGDYDQLYKLISTNETLSPYVSKQGSYLNALNANLSSYGYSDVAAANSALRNVELQRNLIHSNNFDMFNTRNQDATIAEVRQLIKDSGAKTADERATIANYLAGFSNYSNAGSQYQALNVLTGQAADVQLSVNASVENKEELQQTILDQLLEDESIDVETLLKIKPTDIVLDETTGKYTISEQARKLAEDQVKVEKAQTRQSLLDENKDLMTQDTFSKEDYTTLWETGLFETQEELQNYLHQSKETREQIWNNLYSAAVDAESEGLKQAIADAKERLPELEGELTQWYQALGEKSEDLVSRGIVSADDILGLSGEALYRQLDALRFKENQSIETNKGLLSQYDQVKNSTSDEDKNAFAKQLGLDKWDDTKVKEKIANIRAAIVESERIVSEFDEALSKGDSLVSAVADTKTTIANNQDALEATDFYTKWTQEVDKATKASESFAAAVGQQGSLTAEALAELASYDAEVYQKYTNMTSADWNEYVYANAMKYYDDLAKLYADDAAKMIEIQQQKKAATEKYYSQVKALAQQQIEAEQAQTEEQLTKIDSAISELQKSDVSTFTGVAKLKQALIEVGYAAEEADRLIKNIGKDDENATTEELWAKANAEIALLLQQQEVNRDRLGEAKYLVTEEHEGLIYLEDDKAALKQVRNGTGTYDIYTDETGTSLIEPGTNRLVALTKATGEQAGYDIYVNKTGDAAYYLGADGRLHDLAPAGVTSQGYTVYANQTGDGFVYIDPETKKVESLIAADNTDERYTIYADANGEGFFYVIKGTTQLKSLKAAGVTSNGYTIYANPTGDGYKYLNEEGKLIALEAAGTTEAGYTVYATKDTEKDGWIYINESGETVSLKSIGKTETGYNVVADANGALWLFEPDGENSFKLRNLNSEDNQIIEHLMADDPENKFTFNNGIWTVNIDTTPVEKRVKVVVSYEDVRGEISEMNQQWMNAADQKHTYLQGTGFNGFDGIGSVNAIGDYFGFEGAKGKGAANTHWLEDVQTNFGGDLVGWLQQNEIVPNSGNKRARNAYQLGGKELNEEVLAVWKRILDNPDWGWANSTTEGGKFGDSDLMYFDTDTLLQETLRKAGITDMSKYNANNVQVRTATGDYVSFGDYIAQQSEQQSDATQWEIPVDIRYVVNAPEDAENLIPMTKEEFLNSPAVKAATGMMSSWMEAGLDPNQMFKTKDQKFDFMSFLSNMFTIKDDGSLEEGYNKAAYYCMQGFIEGLTGEEPEIQAILNAFGVNSLDTLRAAFGIQSPSKYTREMGRYLVEGLEEGLNETEFSADTFGKKVLEEVKKQIGNITKEDMWDQFVPEKSQAGQVVTIGDKRDYLNRRGVQIERIEQDGQIFYQVWDHEKALLEEVFDSEEAAIDAAGEALLAEDQFAKFVDGGFWTDKDISLAQKSLYDTLIQNTLKKLNKGDTFEEYLKNGGTIDEFTAEWNNQYQEYLDGLENDVDETWAKILDIIDNTLESIDKKDQKKAQAMLTRWQQIFEGIAAARKAAFEDEDATYGSAMSKEQRQAMMTEKFLNGATGSDVLTWLNTKVDVNGSDMQYRSYKTRDLSSLGTAYSGFSHDANGAPIITNALDYYSILRNNEQTRNRELLAQSGMGANIANAYTLLPDLIEKAGGDVGLIDAKEFAQILQQKNPDLKEADATTAALAALELYKNEDTISYDPEAGDNESFSEAILEFLATKMTDNQWSPDVALELAKKVEDPTYEFTNEKAEQIYEQYASDAAAALEDYYAYLESLARYLSDEYKTRTEQRDSDRSIAEKVGNGDDLTAEESAEWEKIQKRYGGAGGTAAGTITNIALAQSADDRQNSLEQQLIAQGVDVAGATANAQTLDERRQILETLAQQYGVTAEASTALGAAEDKLASMVGYTNEEFRELEQTLNETAQIDISTDEGRAELAELAYTVARTKTGYEEFGKVSKTQWKTLTDATKKGTADYRKELKNMKSIMSKMFNTDMKNITSKFVEDHLDEMEKMANGTEEEALAARDAIEDDLVAEILAAQGNSEVEVIINAETGEAQSAVDFFKTSLDQWDGEEYGFTLRADGTDEAANQVINSLNSILSAGTMTADQIEAALNSIGWDPQIEWKEVHGTAAQAQAAHGYVKTLDGYEPIGEEIKGDTELTYYIPHIGSLSKGSPSSAKPSSSSSSGGGGGGSKSAKKVEAPKRGSDEKERYHEITKKLGEQESVLTRLDKLKSRTFGANHLKAINDEIAALEQENKLYAEQAAEATANMDANKARLEQYGATFNEDGTLNYDEYMDQILEQYNAAVEAYNSSSQTAADELALKEAEEIYNEAKKAMEDYEEDMDKLNEAQENMLENQNKISAAMLEGIQYKVELKFDFNDRDIKIMQYFRDKWEELYDMQDESMRYMADEAIKYEDNLNTLGNAMNKLNAEYANGTLNEADYAAGLQDVNDKIVEQLNNLLTIKKSIKEAYGNTLQQATEELSKHTAVLEHSYSVMEQYIQLQQLMGLGADYSGLSRMYEVQYSSSVMNVKAAKEYLDTLKNSKKEIEANIAIYGETDVLKQQLDDVNAAIQEGEDDLLSKTNQALTDAQNMFNNTMQAIVQTFDEQLFRMKNGLANLEDDYAYYQEEQARYLSTSKELYEVSKLNRQINDSIADATTKTSKERLKALQEYINAQADSTRLTEYDVQMMELQYKHALALQELEDARNAKSVVRLTRDENGNFGYQYTADDQNISDAQQKVEDALQQINELAANRVAEIEQAAIQAEREYRDSLLTIAADTTLTLEERQAKMEELTKRYAKTMQFNQEQYNNASNALLTNQQYVYERYGVSIMSNTQTVQDQMKTSVGEMISQTTDYATFLQKQMSEGGAIYEALQTYKDNITTVNGVSGLHSWENMVASAADFEEANEAAADALSTINDTLETTLTNIADVTGEWEDHAAALDTVIANYEKLGQTAVDTLRKLAGNLDETEPTATSGAATDEEIESTEKQWMYSWGYGGYSGSWSGYDSRKAAIAGAKSDIYQKIMSTLEAGETDEETASNRSKLQAKIDAALKTIQVTKYKTGGLIDYTGPAWVDGSLSNPELMLNSDDTRNMLRTIQLVRDLDIETLTSLYEAINQTALGMMYSLSGIAAPSGSGVRDVLEQNVQITAEFPNATDRNEITAAFEDIVNLAAQYANRR